MLEAKEMGGPKEAEAYQSVLSARAFVLAGFTTHLIYFSRVETLEMV
jgi:hypothetical protein